MNTRSLQSGIDWLTMQSFRHQSTTLFADQLLRFGVLETHVIAQLSDFCQFPELCIYSEAVNHGKSMGESESSRLVQWAKLQNRAADGG